MERLVDRARAAMNLILVTSLLVFWAVLNTGPDIMILANRINAEAEALSSRTKILDAELAEATKSPEKSSSAPWPNAKDFSFLPDSVKDFLATVNDVGLGKMSLDGVITMNADVDTSYYSFGWFKIETHYMNVIIGARLQQMNSALGLDEQEILKWQPRGWIFYNQDRRADFPKFYELKENLAVSLNRLEQIIDEWKLAPNQSFDSAQSALTASIKLPILNQEIASRSAPMVVLFALIAPLLYLISICQTIKHRAGRAQVNGETGGFDWIFLHESYVGPILGTGWLLLPVATIIIGISEGIFDVWESALLLLGSGGVSGWVIVCAWRLRKIYYSKAA